MTAAYKRRRAKLDKAWNNGYMVQTKNGMHRVVSRDDGYVFMETETRHHAEKYCIELSAMLEYARSERGVCSGILEAQAEAQEAQAEAQEAQTQEAREAQEAQAAFEERAAQESEMRRAALDAAMRECRANFFDYYTNGDSDTEFLAWARDIISQMWDDADVPF